MLVLTRCENEEIVIAIDGREVLRIGVAEVKSRSVRLWFDGDEAAIWRGELWEGVRTSASATSAEKSA